MQVLIDATIRDPISPGELHEWLSQAPVQLGFQQINPVIIIPLPGALVGHVLLAESHINVDLVFKANYASIDIFTCGFMNAELVDGLVSKLPIDVFNKQVLERGLEYSHSIS